LADDGISESHGRSALGIPHISADMREVLGAVPIVTRPEQFWEYIEQSNA